MPARDRSALFWGLLLILLGLGFLLNAFNLVPPNVLAWWPLLVIGAGMWLLIQAVTRRRGGGMVGGTVLAALGVFWLLESLGRVDDRLFVPVLLIAIGVGLLLRSLRR